MPMRKYVVLVHCMRARVRVFFLDLQMRERGVPEAGLLSFISLE